MELPAVSPAVFENAFVRLERLTEAHVEGLHAAAAKAPALYDLAPVPVTLDGMQAYVSRAVEDARAGRALPYAVVAKVGASGAPAPTIAGCTRLMNLEWWSWPPTPIRVEGEPRRRELGSPPDVAEIGHVWLGQPWLRTAVNTASCLLLMTFAFEEWKVHRLVLKTDERNARSRAAILRLGGQFEGILRAHLPAADGVIRNTAMFSILPAEWPAVKSRLESALTRAHHGAPRL
jgi:RimJ/RimL family protein N-acetyltransferase